jgi:hypothetical protein
MILLTREQADDWPKDWIPDPAGGALKIPVLRGLTAIVAEGLANWKQRTMTKPTHLLLGYGGTCALRREVEKFGLFRFSGGAQTDTFLGLEVHYSNSAGVEILSGNP